MESERPPDLDDTAKNLLLGDPGLAEVLKQADEFLEALAVRLNEIVTKPSGRFVVSYMSGRPGSRTPPSVQ